MMFADFDSSEVFANTTRQIWSNYFTITVGVVAFLLLVSIRNASLNAFSVYENNVEGIVAYYPQDWLIDEDGDEDYIFRVQNAREIGFNTTFLVSTRTVGADVTARAVFDILAMERSQILASYRLLSVSHYDGLGDVQARVGYYSYVSADPNPFQESIPVVVRGADVLILSGEQVIVVTMLSSDDSFAENFRLFERFLSRLEF